MNWKKFVTLGVLTLLLVSIFGTAAAGSGNTPTVAPTPTKTGTEGIESRFFTHPIVALLGAYFGRPTAPTFVIATTPVPGGAIRTSTPGSELGQGETNAELVGEEIAAYHEAGMGFGVLVKLYAMAEASVVGCLNHAGIAVTTTPVVGARTTILPVCTPTKVAELVSAFNSGSGMGQLFKEYGKPALLGVGQVRKELAKSTPEPVTNGTLRPTLKDTDQLNNMPNGKPTRVPMIKPNHGNGNGNGNGNENGNGKGMGQNK